MKYHVGQPVEGEDFFDRIQEIASMWRSLEGNSLLLLAPRRVGKTSLMKAMVTQAEAKGFQAVFLSLEDTIDEADFVQQLLRVIARHKPKSIEKLLLQARNGFWKSTLKRIKKVGGFGMSLELNDEEKAHWRELIQGLGDLLSSLDRPWLLVIDELPLFILKLLREDESAERASVFLHNLRELRQRHPNLRWVIAGSIGLDTVTSRHRLTDSINDLKITGLGAFTESSARALLQELAASYDLTLSAEVVDHILQRLEWLLPYYLQLAFSVLVDLNESHGRQPDVAMIDETFDSLMQPSNKAYFDYWRQRLRDELGTPDDAHATALLNHICRSPQGSRPQALKGVMSKRINDPETRDQQLRYLLDILENDGYLVMHEDRYRFRFPLLREFWLRRVAP